MNTQSIKDILEQFKEAVELYIFDDYGNVKPVGHLDDYLQDVIDQAADFNNIDTKGLVGDYEFQAVFETEEKRDKAHKLARANLEKYRYTVASSKLTAFVCAYIEMAKNQGVDFDVDDFHDDEQLFLERITRAIFK